ncbi:MAG: hypothetical protein F6K54_01035 [Okeania sp. SIO3B5]|uniref:hypothetical protein n=1 Tax=Okeania sp. SIO3B5 TaxID=2607811 RepID=UPI0014014F1E|nr:hypothetical protein [Okeania sp. SIO3B5]NEO51794.1 hypothetical protein [Okeania sp. SIO3B5]
MLKEYTNSQEVLNAMQTILDSCAELKNYIDGIAFLLNASSIAKSQVPGEGGSMDTKVIAPMISNFEQTAKDTFGEDIADLQYITFMKKNKANQELSAWSIVFVPDTNYKLVFTGNLQGQKSNLQTHQATVPEYVEELLPLIDEYKRLT